jgi:hypothetical protein
MEDDHIISKVEYLSDSLLDQTLTSTTKAKYSNTSNEDDLPWKTISKYYKWNISATTYGILLKL